MDQAKPIHYRGVEMSPDWPAKIVAAQQIVALTHDGQIHPRVRYGDERDNRIAEFKACRDWGVLKSEYHVLNCDVEQCPKCGRQLITCDCTFDDPDGGA